MSTVLIVEDQERVAKAIELLLDLHGIATVIAPGPDEALAAFRRHDVDLVIQDMNFSLGATSGAEGLDLFRRIRQRDPALPILLMTAWASLETAVRLMKEGASDYVEKRWDDDKLLAGVRNLLRMRALEVENRRLKGNLLRMRALEVENRRLKGDRRRAREDLAERYDLCGLGL